MNGKTSIYLTLNEDYLVKTKAKALKENEMSFGAEGKGTRLYPSMEYIFGDESGFNEDEQVIRIEGKLWDNDTELGYLSFDFPLDLDTAAEIIQFYVKKLNKIKSVLEATK